MNSHDVNAAITHAHASIPALHESKPIGLCDLADACYAFLEALKTRAPWYLKIGIRAIHGAISAWKRERNC